MAAFWERVRAGQIPSPRRHRKYPDAIRILAGRYIWWLPADEALAFPLRLVAQVMNIGTLADVLVMQEYFGQETMKKALTQAQPGWFRERSWYFWHYKLELTPWGDEPVPLPTRTYDV